MIHCISLQFGGQSFSRELTSFMDQKRIVIFSVHSAFYFLGWDDDFQASYLPDLAWLLNAALPCHFVVFLFLFSVPLESLLFLHFFTQVQTWFIVWYLRYTLRIVMKIYSKMWKMCYTYGLVWVNSQAATCMGTRAR